MDKSPSALAGVSPLNVIVIGGSLTGLMQGIMLKRLGHHVRILEKSPTSVRESETAGITSGLEVQAFLQEYDIFGSPWAVPAPGIKVLNDALKVQTRRKTELCNTSWDVLYYRLRASFDGLESEYCSQQPSVKVENDGKAIFECGKRVTKVVDDGAVVAVEYKDLIDSVDGTFSADLVIAADGAASNIRRMILPASDLGRPYSGYVVWRGTIPETQVTEATKTILGQEFNLYITVQSYMIVYMIPGVAGSVKEGERLLNLAWYCNCTEEALADILTDVDGHRHQYTLPSGSMRDEVWARQKAAAEKILPSPFLELVNKIRKPFISVVSDTMSSQASFMDGKLLLVGDALTLFRPHIALSTNQAAFHALLLKRAMTGKITIPEWETRVLQYARANRLRAISWGAYFQVGWLSYLASEVYYRSELARQWLVNRWHGRRIGDQGWQWFR